MTDNEITYKIIGCCYDVYNTLGPGLLESVYEEALAYELRQAGLDVKTQEAVPILYKGQRLHSTLQLDIMVNDAVIVELKSVEELKGVYFKQLQTYLKLTGHKTGLLINFNTDDLQKNGIRRIVM